MKIVNLNSKPPTPWIYVGRYMGYQNKGVNGDAIFLKASPLGNPFKLQCRDPEEVRTVLEQYRAWLYGEIQAGNKSVLSLLKAIDEDTTLACWCCEMEGEEIFDEPLVCHAQLIFRAARWLKSTSETALEVANGK